MSIHIDIRSTVTNRQNSSPRSYRAYRAKRFSAMKRHVTPTSLYRVELRYVPPLLFALDVLAMSDQRSDIAAARRTAIQDGIIEPWDVHRALTHQYEGNCEGCGRVGPFPGVCRECEEPTTLYITRTDDVICPFLMARFKRLDEAAHLRCASSTRTEAKKPFQTTRFNPERLAPWVTRWADGSNTGYLSLIALMHSDFDAMRLIAQQDYDFFVALSRPVSIIGDTVEDRGADGVLGHAEFVAPNLPEDTGRTHGNDGE